MLVSQKVQILNDWGRAIKERPPFLQVAVVKSSHENLWFDQDSQWEAIDNIVDSYLLTENLDQWIRSYPQTDNPKKVAIIMAGNIPLVGFHDLLSVIVSGHYAIVKLSDKDKFLLPALIRILERVNKNMAAKVKFVDSLNDFDAVIATGSDQSAEFFHKYFADYPSIIRKNRNSFALLSGEESEKEIKGIARDIMKFYGLGCRSVSKVFIKSKNDRHRLFKAIDDYSRVLENERYYNNFKYNYAIYMMNNEEFETNNIVIMKENPSLQSRIACVHYETYQDIEEVIHFANNNKDGIQCIVSHQNIDGIKTVSPGDAQSPNLFDYADNIDTRNFLSNL